MAQVGRWAGRAKTNARKSRPKASARAASVGGVFLAVLGSFAVTLTTGSVAGATTPGSPGTPQAPTVVYAEGFENGTGTTQELLTSYTGAPPASETYTADPAWLTNCNGEIVEFNTPYTDLGNCASTAFTSHTRQLAYALGALAGAADPSSNHAVTAYTEGNPGANLVEFQTVNPLPLPQAGRFLDFSVDAAAENCGVSAPLYQFNLLNGATSTPVGGVINACTSTTTETAPAVGVLGAQAVKVGTYTSNGSVLFTGSSFGVSMTNGNGSGNGNDAAFDNIQVLDVTPQLDKSFSPATVEAGHASTLTFTITNTSELAAKDGWSFTDALPSGLVVTTPAASTTCPSGVVTAAAGASSVHVTGDLNAGMASCTVTVNVTSYTAGAYTNDASNVTETGLNPPGSTMVTFTTPPAWTCSAFGYLFQDPTITPPGTIYQVDLVTGAYTNYGSTTANVNAVGYNTLDNYMYGWDNTNNQLVQVASDGTLIPLGVPAGVDTSVVYNVGDFDSSGHYWMMNSATGQWYEIDLAPGSATYGQVLKSGTVTTPTTVTQMPSDWAFINGAFYGMATTTSGPADLVQFNPNTGVATDLGPIAGVPGTDIYGAAYASPGGYLWVSDNVTGEIYRVTVAAKTAIAVAPGPPSGNNDGARCATAPIPTITVTKTVDGRVQAADQFTVGLKNSGGTTLTSASTSGTNTSASTTNWPVTQGATYTITDAMAAGSPDALSQYVPTIACLDTTTGGPITPGGTAPDWTLPVSTTDAYSCNVTNSPAAVDLSVTKTANPNPYTAGQPLTYTVTVKNAGPATAIGASVSDPLPAQLAGGGFTWVCVPSAGSSCTPSGTGDITEASVTVLAGGQLTYTVSGTVPSTVTGSISNTATVTPPPGIPDPNCTPDCSATVVNPPPTVDLAVTKTASPNPYVPGQTLTYTVTVTNTGPDSAIGAKLSDPLPAGLAPTGFTWTCTPSAGSTCTASGSGNISDTVSVASGGTLTYTVTGTVPSSLQTSLTNTATLTPPPGAIDPGCSPNCSSTVTDPANPTVDLAVTKTATPSPYVPGQPLTYTVTVTNGGPSDAIGASVSDPLPAALSAAGFTWTCAPAPGSTCTASGSGDITDTVTIPAGGNLVYTVTGTVPASVQTGLTNTATVTPPPGTTDPGCTPGCAATATDQPNPTVNLVVNKAASPNPYIPGDQLTYTVTVTNAGPSDALGASVSDPLPGALSGAGFTWTCTASTGSTCTASGSGDITDTVDVAAGGTLTYTVTGTAPSSVQTTLANTATVTPPPGSTDANCTPDCRVDGHRPGQPDAGSGRDQDRGSDPVCPGGAVDLHGHGDQRRSVRRDRGDGVRPATRRPVRGRVHLDVCAIAW